MTMNQTEFGRKIINIDDEETDSSDDSRSEHTVSRSKQYDLKSKAKCSSSRGKNVMFQSATDKDDDDEIQQENLDSCMRYKKKQKVNDNSDHEPKEKSLQISESHPNLKYASFFVALIDPVLSAQRLPVGFKRIAYINNLCPGLFKITTVAGLSWTLQLVKEGYLYYFKDGWITVCKQLMLSVASKLLFQYKGASTFLMTVFPHSQEFQISTSFNHILLNTNESSMDLPSCFFIYNFGGIVPEGIVNLQITENQKWKLKIKEFEGRFKLVGWKNVVDEANLVFGSFIVFHFVSKSQLDISVYDLSGVNCLLPANSTETVDVVHKSVQKSEVVEDKPHQKRFLSKGGQSKVEQDMVFFTQKVETRLHVPTSIVREVQNMSQQLICLQYNAMPLIKCSIERTNAMKEKYVLSGWRSFMEQYGICKNQVCHFKYFKSKSILVVTKVE